VLDRASGSDGVYAQFRRFELVDDDDVWGRNPNNNRWGPRSRYNDQIDAVYTYELTDFPRDTHGCYVRLLPQEVKSKHDESNFEEVIIVALKHDMCRQCFETLHIRGVQAVVFNDDFFVSTFFNICL
jgi:hypothetical protein